jgi:hypothetical protein
MSLLLRTGFVIAGISVLAGCDVFGPRLCSESRRIGITVTVRDSITGASLTEGVRVIARDGIFADTADANAFSLAEERPGNYTVTVEKEGYQPWSRDDIRVIRGECHGQRVELVALLKQ